MNAPESCDIAVIGGGPAGATCARALTRAGLKVVVMDSKEFPRDKVCAGWVTPAVMETLAIRRSDYASERVLQPIRGFRTGIMGEQAVTTEYQEIVSYGIRRYEFDDYLLRRSGARLNLGEALSSLRPIDEGWLLNNRLSARMVVGAGGHHCPVARHLGARLGRNERPVAAQEVEFELNDEQQAACPVREEMPELYFCPDLKGYGWVFRKGAWLNIGLGRESKREAAGQMACQMSTFVAQLQAQGRIPADLPTRFHGHAYLLHRRPAPRPRIGDRVLLVGDAAGLAYPQSGEGIRPAVESALLAARTIIDAHGDYRRERLRPYAERLRQRFGKGEPSGDWVPEGLKRHIGRWLLGNPLFTRHVVLDRWFLHRRQMSLI